MAAHAVLTRSGTSAQVFFTGSAGVGKSWLIAHIIGLLRERYGEVTSAFYASTPVAVC